MDQFPSRKLLVQRYICAPITGCQVVFKPVGVDGPLLLQRKELRPSKDRGVAV